MLKKIRILLLGILALLFCISVFSTYFSQDAHATLWERVDTLCPDKIHEKTRCIAGGNELCEPQYCNDLEI
jgi:hypothetical protein